MADQHYVERQRVVEEKSNGSLAFIVGGLVVAVAFIVWLFASDGVFKTTTVTTPAPAGETNISIDNSTPEPAPAAPADDAAAPADSAPADTAPAAGADQ